MASFPNKTVAVIDDHRYLRESLKDLLEAAGYESDLYDSAEAFLNEKGYSNVDCILADVRMPGMSGVEMLQALSKMPSHPPVIIMTAHGDKDIEAAVFQAGAITFLRKPVNADLLMSWLERAISDYRGD
ncbi:FixJ family two-component response regulator [Rhizobium sp. BK529]|uniref:response regulator transcription factor n=1 Tax=unclassified Rhizobium TaxID=2613769 RepID=UPI00104B9D5C|nr:MULTISPECIES: response regulator [unclassified Rhizobium]MBB3594255.1 FixJ family two-component response regulator [Rhizobium sp. BK529]TCS01711.1 response regulator receiver domain-containing protein [Rhizobium sp. BK418]